MGSQHLPTRQPQLPAPAQDLDPAQISSSHWNPCMILGFILASAAQTMQSAVPAPFSNPIHQHLKLALDQNRTQAHALLLCCLSQQAATPLLKSQFYSPTLSLTQDFT